SSGSAAIAAAASCAVTPPNVSVAFCSELPVLPPAGRPPRIADTSGAVPPSHLWNADCWPTGQRAASTAAAATSALTARWQDGSAAATGCPDASVMDSTGSGAQYVPPAATVAYASARSSGVVS